MGDTNMDKDDDLVDYDEVDLNGNPIPKPNEGDEDAELRGQKHPCGPDAADWEAPNMPGAMN